MYKVRIPEHLRDLSGTALKEAMRQHREHEIVKLVCRQTDYTAAQARPLLQENQYNYLKVIKEWLKPDIQKDKREEKPLKSLNQKIIGEIRNFMDEGAKLAEYRKQQMAFVKKMKHMQKMELEARKKKAMEEGNKKLT